VSNCEVPRIRSEWSRIVVSYGKIERSALRKKSKRLKKISRNDAANREQASRTEDPDKGLVPEDNSPYTLMTLPDTPGLLVEQQQGSLIDCGQSPTSGIVIASGKVSGSHFGLGCIIAVVRFVSDGVVSMRAAARISGIVNQLAGGPRFDYPSRMTVQNFILRIGLYLLQSVSPQSDWIWIVDHTFSVGTFKVMIVLGIRHSEFVRLERPLTYRELTVIAILSVETSNGEVVKQQFDKLAEKNGVPVAILSDAGSDLSKGTRLFQAEHPEVVPLYDIKHLVSRTVEKIMTPQEQWESFRSACTNCANTVRQSPLAHLKPPRPKTKARYMNIDREIQWAARMLWVLDRVRSGHLTDVQKKRLPQELVEEKFSWLDQYRDSINQWEELSHMSRAVLRNVRRHGYGNRTMEAITRLNTPTISDASRTLIAQVTERIKPMCESGQQFDRLPSSSEILESMMGRAKRLLSGTAAGTTNSLTGQILSLVACTREITPTLVRAALSTVSIKCVSKWFSDNFGTSANYQRSQDLTPTPADQNVRKPQSAAIPNF
jgi:hypothetical protein